MSLCRCCELRRFKQSSPPADCCAQAMYAEGRAQKSVCANTSSTELLAAVGGINQSCERPQRVHAFQRLRIGFAYCSTSIFFHCLTPFRIRSSDFSRADLNSGHKNGKERTLQLNL